MLNNLIWKLKAKNQKKEIKTLKFQIKLLENDGCHNFNEEFLQCSKCGQCLDDPPSQNCCGYTHLCVYDEDVYCEICGKNGSV